MKKTPINVDLLAGSVACTAAGMFWQTLGKNRRAVLWDVPMPRRQGYLHMSWFNADVVGLAWDGSKLLAAAWITPLGPKSRCGIVHFAFAPNVANAAAIGAEFHKRLAGQYASLLGIIPKPFRHAIAFARGAGYAVGPTLAGACPLADLGKVVDGVVVTREIEIA